MSRHSERHAALPRRRKGSTLRLNLVSAKTGSISPLRQRRDHDVVVLTVCEDSLDRLEGVRAAEEPVNGTAGGVGQQLGGALRGPVDVLGGTGVGDQERKRGRSFTRSTRDPLEQQGRRCGPVGDDEGPRRCFHWSASTDQRCVGCDDTSQ